ncbi:acyclic terpene utilization AtuA family protein [Rhodococcus sp. NCIMB 12038]|uniref:acyclic terpene utilization AtuA family protein n=1 Tax=Rhodococcus sp. NCIMB 12038 TaxID=933800 RepID=UPI000B3C3321|nr:acyclic terpene utilization AtuA family protein [Rhodococcus sp. NCIMB 12038]OUS92119.1 hypothetical protein CA951_29875 [Rhodococcus sp. NCIMB 12038]
MNPDLTSPLRIGQFSAYYGDRDSAMAELIDSDCQVLTGDYLAELTMLVLRKNQLRGGVGYAEGFIDQVKSNLSSIAERKIKLITNAGGLEPEACAAKLRVVCAQLGVDLRIASITGDDQLHHLDNLREHGARFQHIDTGEELDVDSRPILTANAYLGAWPIVEALERGADIVICPRVTDAALVIGASAWHFGWKVDDLDQLAGSLVAGHIIECGCQATGGNYSNFDEFDDLGLPGMPIAEINGDGSCTITKSANSGGVVDVGTVTAQLLYEVGSPLYHNPDVIADLSTVTLTNEGPNRVRVDATRGLAPTDQLKLSLAFEGGYRNQVTVGLTGGRIEAKEAWLRRQVASEVGDPESFDGFRWTRIGPTTTEGGSYDESTALVVISAKDRDRKRVSRANFSDSITQLGTSSIPGFYTFTPPARERLIGVQWPSLIPKGSVTASVSIDGQDPIEIPWHSFASGPAFATEGARSFSVRDWSSEASEFARLDELLGTRSGDKAGLANVGVWARSEESFDWLASFLTVERFKDLVPDARELRVVRHALPNLNALNFMVHGWLEEGVASCTRVDAQAKGLGEYLGSQKVAIPRALLH